MAIYAEHEPIVYFLKAGKEVKIGTTTNLNNRAREIQNSVFPVRVELLGVVDGGRSIEKAIHQEFRQANTWGEWFWCCATIKTFITTYAYLPVWWKEINKDWAKLEKRYRDNQASFNARFPEWVLRRTGST